MEKIIGRRRARSWEDRAKLLGVTRRGGRDVSEVKWDWGGREAADDGAASRSAKALQFGKIGNAKKGKLSA